MSQGVVLEIRVQIVVKLSCILNTDWDKIVLCKASRRAHCSWKIKKLSISEDTLTEFGQ